MFKRDLRDNYPDKIFTAPQEELVRYHVSSGTTGKPTVVGYTRERHRPLDHLAGPGLHLHRPRPRRRDPGQLRLRPLHRRPRRSTTVPSGSARPSSPRASGNTERQIELMQDLGATAIACTPSYLLHMGEVAEKMGISIRKDTSSGPASSAPSPGRRRCGTASRTGSGIKAYDIYGTSELSGPMFTECAEQNGIHVWSRPRPDRDHRPQDRGAARRR